MRNSSATSKEISSKISDENFSIISDISMGLLFREKIWFGSDRKVSRNEERPTKTRYKFSICEHEIDKISANN